MRAALSSSSDKVRNAAIRLSALIDLLSVMRDLKAQAGGIVLVYGEVWRGNRQHIAGDATPTQGSIGTSIIIAGFSFLRAGDDHEVEIAAGTRGSACPAAQEVDGDRIQRLDKATDHLVNRLLRSGVSTKVRDRVH